MRYAALVLTICSGLLMVSRLRYTSFKGGKAHASPTGERVPFMLLLGIIVAIVAIYVYPPRLLLTISGLYALSGPALWAWNRLRRRRDSGQGAA